MTRACTITIASLALAACGKKSEHKAAAPEAGARIDATATRPDAAHLGKGDCRADYAPKPALDASPMCKIDGGTFAMGAADDDADAAPIERPVRTITVSPYLLDRFEVTNAQVAAYVGAAHEDCGGAACVAPFDAAGRETLPFVGATDEAAARYCAWAGKRLPTEAEWELAARHDPATGHDLRYPWGDTFEPRRANCNDSDCQDGFDDLAPVGSFGEGASPWGVEDLVGNALEIVADCYAKYTPCTGDACLDPRVDAPASCHRVIRSSAAYQRASMSRATARHESDPSTDRDHGFRCAR